MMEMIRENVKVVLRNKNGVPTISFHKKEEDRWKKRDTTLKLKNVPNNLPTEKKKKVLSFILNKLYYDIAFNVPLKNHCNTLLAHSTRSSFQALCLLFQAPLR